MKTVTQYDEFQAQIDEVADICNFIPDVSTKDGYDKSKRVALDVGKVLTALEKSRKDKKADSILIGKAIDSDAKGIKAKLEAIQEPHKLAYKQLDNEKKEREQARIDELQKGVAIMRELPESLSEADSGSIAGALEEMNAEECLNFYEFSADALKARNYARTELAKMYAKALQTEKDAAELDKLRKSQAEQAIKDREIAAAEKATLAAQRLAADNAGKIEADKQAAIDAQEAAEEATKQAEANRIAEAAQAKSDAVDAANQAEIERYQAAELAKTQQAEAVQAEIDRQAEHDRVIAAETAKREVNNRHVGAVRKAAKEALLNIDGITEKVAKEVIMAITNGCIPAVKISY